MSSGRAKLMNILMRPNRSKLKSYQKQPPPRRWFRQSSGKKMRVVVENLNMGPRKIKADPQRGIKEETIVMERSIHYSNVNLVDPVTGFPTKVTYSYLDDGTKVRISKRSGAIIPKPDVWKQKFRNEVPSEDSDTISDGDVWAKTYEERQSKWEDLTLQLQDDERRKRMKSDSRSGKT